MNDMEDVKERLIDCTAKSDNQGDEVGGSRISSGARSSKW